MDHHPPVSGLPFQPGWTIDDSAILYSHCFAEDGKPLGYDPVHAAKTQKFNDRLYLALGRHIIDLGQRGLLNIPPHSQHLDSQVFKAWLAAAEDSTTI